MSEENKDQTTEGTPEAPKPVPTIVDELVEKFGAVAENNIRGDLTARVSVAALVKVFTYLAKERSPRFNMLVDVTSIDFPGRDKRFDVVYHFLSLESNERFCLKTEINDGEPVPSATIYWDSANWAERETYDMYGLVFRGHPYMKRLLMWEGFDGWPLRKDFPLRGTLPVEQHYRENDISRFRRL